MRGFKLVLLAIALVVSVPMAAFAQATLSGLVRDTSGAVLPGVTVEASSPGSDREGAVGRHRRHRPIHHPRPSSRHIPTVVLADRVQDGRARRRRIERHGGADGQRRSRGRRRAGDDHGVRADAGRGPAVNHAAGGHGSGDRVGCPELTHAVHGRRADPWREEGRVHRPGRRRLGRAGSRLARSQRRPHIGSAHDGQWCGPELGDRRRLGRRRCSERHRNGGIRHRRLGG